MLCGGGLGLGGSGGDDLSHIGTCSHVQAFFLRKLRIELRESKNLFFLFPGIDGDLICRWAIGIYAVYSHLNLCRHDPDESDNGNLEVAVTKMWGHCRIASLFSQCARVTLHKIWADIAVED